MVQWPIIFIPLYNEIPHQVSDIHNSNNDICLMNMADNNHSGVILTRFSITFLFGPSFQALIPRNVSLWYFVC